MPPRLPALPRQLHQFLSRHLQPSFSLLLPQFQHQSRNAHILASLSDTPGAYNKRIRRGRGPASGKGKTSGRGHKGQKQHGKVPAGFTGGQTPEEIVHGKRGFKNIFSADLAPINLDRIQYWIDQKRIDPSRPITVRELADSKCIHNPREGVKLLAHSVPPRPSPSSSSPSTSASMIPPPVSSSAKATAALKQPLHLVVSRASASAIAAVEAAGGSVTTRYYTRASIKRIMRRETHPFVSMAFTKESCSEGLLAAARLPADAIRPAGPGDAEGGSKISESKVMAAKGYKYRLPDPVARRDIEYYRDPAKRGYLSHLLRPLEGPSLFFRSPLERKTAAGVKKEKVLPENRLW